MGVRVMLLFQGGERGIYDYSDIRVWWAVVEVDPVTKSDQSRPAKGNAEVWKSQ